MTSLPKLGDPPPGMPPLAPPGPATTPYGYSPDSYRAPAPAYPPGYAPPPVYLATPGQFRDEDPPSVWPVVLFTVLFGVFGAISAGRRARRAKAMGASQGRYWGVFGGILGGQVVLSLIAFVMLVLLGVSVSASSVMTPDRLADRIVAQGQFRTADGQTLTPSGAQCAATEVDIRGVGDYRCVVDFDASTQKSYTVTVGPGGRWVAVP
jgi:hypothetical protein